MKYIIAGKSEAKGIKGDDSHELNKYFELGWEVVGSRLDSIRYLKTGKLNNDDTTIVTIKDRMFMYSSIFKNVMSYNDFLENKENGKLIDPKIEDWVEKLDFLFLNNDKNSLFWENYDSSVRSNSKYSRYNEDYDEITNGFEKNYSILEKLKKNEKYYVACLRFRDHCDFRSSPQEWWDNLFKKMIEKSEAKIFLVGHGSERFIKNDNMKYIEKLQDYVTLIQDDRCKAVIAQSTGTCGLAFSASKAPIHWIDHANVSFIYENNAVMGGNCAIFTKNHIFKYGSDKMNENGINEIIFRIID